MIIPIQLQKNIISIYGEEGQKWLDTLPILLDDCKTKLQLSLDKCYPDLSFNYVAPALLHDGNEVVLKCGVPGKTQHQEASALRHFNGQGCIKLLYLDESIGVMLLEKADPGRLLEDYTDENQACIFAVELMHQLHKPLENENGFSTLQNWFAGFDELRHRFNGNTGPFPKLLLDKAQKISHNLLTSMNRKVLLHGDLHYANILSSKEHGWIAIDPKGVIGEPEFEIPLPRLGKKINKKIIQHNVDRFIEISGFDRQRILGWLFTKAVLAAWWSFEDNGEIWMPFIECAEVVSSIS